MHANGVAGGGTQAAGRTTGGEVLRARRLEPGKNVRWEITVSPDSNGAVTIVLPATGNCDADGAICTGDGRMLSGGEAYTRSVTHARAAPTAETMHEGESRP